MAKIGDVGTLRELDAKPGDVVRNMVSDCDYNIAMHNEMLFVFWSNGYPSMAVGDCRDNYKLISRTTTQPTLWRDMTDAEKGALLLAAYEGRPVEVHCLTWGVMQWRVHEDTLTFHDHMAYRVRPEPVRETVALPWWEVATDKLKGHRITFDTIDGVPDCNSVKMEKL